jgi:DNA-binding NarL/FixJ family response regulator
MASRLDARAETKVEDAENSEFFQTPLAVLRSRILMSEAMRRVLAVEDTDVIAEQWGRHVAKQGMEFLRAATLADARERIASWPEKPCDYVLLDLKLPDGDGADLLPVLNSLNPRPAVAVITGFLDSNRSVDLYGQCTLVVPKPADPRILRSIIEILEASRQSRPRVDDFAKKYRLSEREREVLFAALRGLNNQETAEELKCDRGTVSTYWNRIFAKTGWRSQRDVIAHLFQHSFGDLDRPAPSSGKKSH